MKIYLILFLTSLILCGIQYQVAAQSNNTADINTQSISQEDGKFY